MKILLIDQGLHPVPDVVCVFKHVHPETRRESLLMGCLKKYDAEKRFVINDYKQRDQIYTTGGFTHYMEIFDENKKSFLMP